jgi:protein Xni
MTEHLLLIDGLNVVRRIWEAIPIEDSPEKAIGAMRSCVASFKRAIEEHSPSHAVAVFDFGGPTWRHALYQEYHAGRKPMPESMRASLTALIAKLREMGIHSFSIPGYEADDVLAAISTRWITKIKSSVTILSTDKDLAMLIAQGVRLRDHFKGEDRDESWVRSKFGVSAAQLHDLLALTGDTTDNVPGVPGVGVKTAAKLLNALGDLEGVLRQAKLVPLDGESSVFSGKVRESLLANEATVRLARELVGFKTDMKLELTLNGIRCAPSIEPESWVPAPSI